MSASQDFTTDSSPKQEGSSSPQEQSQNEENDYLENGSNDFVKYITQMVAASKQSNPKYLCPSCWCFLTRDQKHKHMQSHEDVIKTPKQDADMESYKSMAVANGHFKQIGPRIFYKKVLEKPSALSQQKKKNPNLRI
jgi:hypothetical protein